MMKTMIATAAVAALTLTASPAHAASVADTVRALPQCSAVKADNCKSVTYREKRKGADVFYISANYTRGNTYYDVQAKRRGKVLKVLSVSTYTIPKGR